MDQMNFTDLYQLLVWLSAPIGAGAWMLFVSNAVRNLRSGNLDAMSPANSQLAKWVRMLSPLRLQIYVTVLSLGVPGIAALILAVVPPDMIARLQPAFAVIAMLLSVYITQQIWFQITKPNAVIVALPPAETQQPPTEQRTHVVDKSASISGLGALSPGVSVEPLSASANDQRAIGDLYAELDTLPDTDLHRLRIKIEEVLQSRGSTFRAA